MCAGGGCDADVAQQRWQPHFPEAGTVRPIGHRTYKPVAPPAAVAYSLARQSSWQRDDGFFILLAFLFWLIFVQNLPANLSGMAAKYEGHAFGAANVSDRIIKITMLVASGYIIAIRVSLVRALGRFQNPGLMAFIALAVLSTLWSIDTSATILRLVSLFAEYLVCFAFGLASWHPRRFQQVVIPPIMLILVASLAIGVVAPNLAIEAGDDIALKNSWHGITHAKNEFGMISGFGVILCAHAWITGRRRVLAAIGAAVALTCLLLSRSNTSFFAATLAVGSMLLLLRGRSTAPRYATRVVASIAGTIAFYEAMIQDLIPGVNVLLGPIVGLTGKDTTFSARTVIWRVIKDHIRLSPYLGTGYGAYWIGPLPESPSYIFLSVMYLYPTESHNGYLEVVNDLGFAGLACTILFLVFYMRQAIQLMQSDRSQATLYLALLFDEMVMNMSESDWFSRSNTFAILVLGAFSLSRALHDSRLRQRDAETSSEAVLERG
jgi:exopolysaccharide production protein ExoQ